MRLLWVFSVFAVVACRVVDDDKTHPERLRRSAEKIEIRRTITSEEAENKTNINVDKPKNKTVVDDFSSEEDSDSEHSLEDFEQAFGVIDPLPVIPLIDDSAKPAKRKAKRDVGGHFFGGWFVPDEHSPHQLSIPIECHDIFGDACKHWSDMCKSDLANMARLCSETCGLCRSDLTIGANVVQYYSPMTYSYRPVSMWSHPSNGSWAVQGELQFDVLSCGYSHLALFRSLGEDYFNTTDAYEIVFGGWGNTLMGIRRDLQGQPVSWAWNLPHRCDVWNGYTVSWNDGTIKVFSELSEQMVVYNDPNWMEIKAVGISGGFGRDSLWRFITGPAPMRSPPDMGPLDCEVTMERVDDCTMHWIPLSSDCFTVDFVRRSFFPTLKDFDVLDNYNDVGLKSDTAAVDLCEYQAHFESDSLDRPFPTEPLIAGKKLTIFLSFENPTTSSVGLHGVYSVDLVDNITYTANQRWCELVNSLHATLQSFKDRYMAGAAELNATRMALLGYLADSDHLNNQLVDIAAEFNQTLGQLLAANSSYLVAAEDLLQQNTSLQRLQNFTYVAQLQLSVAESAKSFRQEAVDRISQAVTDMESAFETQQGTLNQLLEALESSRGNCNVEQCNALPGILQTVCRSSLQTCLQIIKEQERQVESAQERLQQTTDDLAELRNQLEQANQDLSEAEQSLLSQKTMAEQILEEMQVQEAQLLSRLRNLEVAAGVMAAAQEAFDLVNATRQELLAQLTAVTAIIVDHNATISRIESELAALNVSINSKLGDSGRLVLDSLSRAPYESCDEQQFFDIDSLDVQSEYLGDGETMNTIGAVVEMVIDVAEQVMVNFPIDDFDTDTVVSALIQSLRQFCDAICPILS